MRAKGVMIKEGREIWPSLIKRGKTVILLYHGEPAWVCRWGQIYFEAGHPVIVRIGKEEYTYFDYRCRTRAYEDEPLEVLLGYYYAARQSKRAYLMSLRRMIGQYAKYLETSPRRLQTRWRQLRLDRDAKIE